MRRLLTASANFVPYSARNHIRKIPGLAALQRFLVANFLSGKPFIHTINAGPARGLRFEVTLPLDKTVWIGTYEQEFATAIAKGIVRGDVCYDIGGFRGYMSGLMGLNGASKVIVFEPLPANQTALQRLMDLNPGLPIDMEPVAIGNVDASMNLKIMPELSMGKLEISSFQQDALPAGQIQVSVRRLDGFVAEEKIPPPNLMKIDVEGAELQVLEGATHILQVARPKIFLEAHSAALENACNQVLGKFNYKITRMGGRPENDEDTRHLICLPT